MSKPVGDSGKVPFNYKPDEKKQPKEGEEGHVKKVVGNIAGNIISDYTQQNPEAAQKGQLKLTDVHIPSDMPPEIPQNPSNVANKVFSPKSQKSTSNRPPLQPNMGELANNPLMMKMRKKADYEGEIKQSPSEAKAQKEFADKAEGLGYRFNPDFEMYVPIKEGSKEALTKDEMVDLIEGRFIPTSSKPKEVKYEGRDSELDAFARASLLEFDEDSGMYVSTNPFVKVQNATIDEMKELMEAEMKTQQTHDIAKAQGYRPVPGMDGVYTNDEGEYKAADEFK